MAVLTISVAMAACGHGDGSPPTDAHEIDAREIDAREIDARESGNALAQTLYINVEGVTVVAASADDATRNRASRIVHGATLRPWLATDPDRTAKVDAVLTEITTILGPYDLAIVTTRPAAGPYHMLVITDDRDEAVGLRGVAAITGPPCNRTPSPVSLYFAGNLTASESLRPHMISQTAIAFVGLQAAVPLSNVARDCMCLSGTNCQWLQTDACTIGGPGTVIDTAPNCPHPDPTMDEAALFLAAFGPS